jgi:hypothetical protein
VVPSPRKKRHREQPENERRHQDMTWNAPTAT